MYRDSYPPRPDTADQRYRDMLNLIRDFRSFVRGYNYLSSANDVVRWEAWGVALSKRASELLKDGK